MNQAGCFIHKGFRQMLRFSTVLAADEGICSWNILFHLLSATSFAHEKFPFEILCSKEPLQHYIETDPSVSLAWTSQQFDCIFL